MALNNFKNTEKSYVNLISEDDAAPHYVVTRVCVGGSASYCFFKRSLDIFFSAIFGIVLILPMCIIAVLVRTTSKGAAIFRQERLGKDGIPFTIYKFRTMYLDSEDDIPRFTEINDKRCTKLGRTLRKYHLDELPQLWNIFKGEMSFVGPRPERPYFYKKFEENINGFSYRLSVKPGITGLAQINGGYYLPPHIKVAYDMEYIENRGFNMDIKCLLGSFHHKDH